VQRQSDTGVAVDEAVRVVAMGRLGQGACQQFRRGVEVAAGGVPGGMPGGGEGTCPAVAQARLEQPGRLRLVADALGEGVLGIGLAGPVVAGDGGDLLSAGKTRRAVAPRRARGRAGMCTRRAGLPG
jgi:hypothetical protein